MSWKKKSDEEVDAAVTAGDYTGGYDFWPWLLYMRISYILPILGLFAMGSYLIVNNQDGYSPAASMGLGIFFSLGGVLFCYKLIKEYGQLKKGQSS